MAPASCAASARGFGDPFEQRVGAVIGVEADVELRRRARGITLCAGLPTSMLVTSRFEGSKPGAPSSSFRAFSACSVSQQRGHRIHARGGGRRRGPACRPSSMTTFKLPRRPFFIDIADARLAGRFADEAMIDLLAFGGERCEHALGAIDGRAFLIARQQERDRSRGRAFARESSRVAAIIAAIAVFMSVAPRPTSLPSRNVGRERIDAPALAGRHHVEVAGKAEVRRRRRRSAHRDYRQGRTSSRRTRKPSFSKAACATSSTPASRRGHDSGNASGPGRAGWDRRCAVSMCTLALAQAVRKANCAARGAHT